MSDNYKQKYNKMLVGTTENNIPFYVKQGFDKYEKTIKNYFVDNYDEEIFDGDLQCVDMYYYSNDLKKAKKEMCLWTESIVKFSRKYGVAKAAYKFGECKRTIYRWRKILSIYSNR